MSRALREMHEEVRSHDAWLFGELPARTVVRQHARSETQCPECERELLESPHAYWCARRVRPKGAATFRKLGTQAEIEARVEALKGKPTVGALRRQRG